MGKQAVRLYRDAAHAEVQYTVGPIPVGDDEGKEVIVRYDTSVPSGDAFFTDSNGRDYLRRVRNKREEWDLNITEPIAGNYYPVSAGVFVEGTGSHQVGPAGTDGDRQLALSVLVDRAVGAASLAEGQVELMLHRRMLYDDHRGVWEALNETVCVGAPPVCQGLTVRGTQLVHVGPARDAARWRRLHTQRLLSPLLLAFGFQENVTAASLSAQHDGKGRTGTPSTSSSGSSSSSSNSGGRSREEGAPISTEGTQKALPPNVALITLQELPDGGVLLRLAHLYELGEDPEYSAMAAVDLRDLLPGRQIEKVDELTLTANQLKEEHVPLKWRTDGEQKAAGKDWAPRRGAPLTPGSFLIELAPMEIRTFSLTLS